MIVLVSLGSTTTTSALLPSMPSAARAALAALVFGPSKPQLVDDEDLALGWPGPTAPSAGRP